MPVCQITSDLSFMKVFVVGLDKPDRPSHLLEILKGHPLPVRVEAVKRVAGPALGDGPEGNTVRSDIDNVVLKPKGQNLEPREGRSRFRYQLNPQLSYFERDFI